jgi:RNA polymerase sigma factor (sigma-70 family)
LIVMNMSRFDALYEQLRPALYGLAYRVIGDRGESDEVVQEALLRLSTHEVLARPEDEVAAWARRVCVNLAFNRRRSAARSFARDQLVGRLEQGGNGADPAVAVLQREGQDEVRRALAELPERQRECLLLRHSGYSYAEIAATLEIAIGSVGVLLARGEKMFRETYGEKHVS